MPNMQEFKRQLDQRIQERGHSFGDTYMSAVNDFMESADLMNKNPTNILLGVLQSTGKNVLEQADEIKRESEICFARANNYISNKGWTNQPEELEASQVTHMMGVHDGMMLLIHSRLTKVQESINHLKSAYNTDLSEADYSKQQVADKLTEMKNYQKHIKQGNLKIAHQESDKCKQVLDQDNQLQEGQRSAFSP